MATPNAVIKPSAELAADVVEALQAAANAVTKNDYRTAIELLTAANRKHRDKHLEQRLVDLRVEGFGSMSWPAPAGDWPPATGGEFRGAEGLPEINASELSVEKLRSGILDAGGLIVRGLMAPELVAVMREAVDNTLAARRDILTGTAPDNADEWYARSNKVAGGPVQFGSLGGEKYTESGSAWSADSPRAAFEQIEFYKQIGLPQILREYFNEDAVLSVKKWVLRRVKPNNGNKAGWHQDGRFLGAGIRTVNMWVSLSDCGGDAAAPGMDIVAGPDKTIYETGTHGAVFDWTVGQGLVDKIGETAPVLCPRFYPGDALFFDHYNLHRTGFGDNHSQDRYALESWFFASSRAPMKQGPLVL
jgi:hypothetical protein